MKNYLKIFMLIGLVSSCTHNKMDAGKMAPAGSALCTSLPWGDYKAIQVDEVEKMQENYRILVKARPDSAVVNINFDGDQLRKLACNMVGVKIIMVCKDVTTPSSVSAVVQVWDGKEFNYFDIDEIFNSSQPGMRGQRPLCPPPLGCALPTSSEPAPGPGADTTHQVKDSASKTK